MGLRSVLLLLVLSWSAVGRAATFVVTSAADTAGSSCGSVCTLRQAITAANATAAADTINFAITLPPRGEILISPTSLLPVITHPLTINGYSQSGTRVNDDPVFSNAVPRIRLDGISLTGSAIGLLVCAPDVTIRGLSLTRFGTMAISVGDFCPQGSDASNARIHGNFIGLTTSGSALAANAIGVRVRASAFIGSANPADRNVFAGTRPLEVLAVANVQVDGNLFGTARNGQGSLGGAVGLRLLGTTNSGIGLGLANRIRNYDRGIQLTSTSRNADFANNSIGNSAVLGIDLNENGVTLNDSNDLDTGANDLQNFPVLTAASRVAGGVSLSGTLDVGHPGSIAYKLTTYASAACHPSGHGEGERILGQTSRNFSSTVESFAFTQTTGDSLPPGTVITMTATRSGVGTSEFSACFALDPPALVVNSNDDIADGVCNAAHCSLRDAIIVSNNASGSGFSRIHFAIPPLGGNSEIVIAPTSPLPAITRTVTLDGYTQPGTAVNTDPLVSNALLRIRLDGVNVSNAGLRMCAPGVVRGLSLVRFGVALADTSCAAGSGFVELQGSFVGLAADGTTALFNDIGVIANQRPVRIGGSDPASRNVLANQLSSVILNGTASSGSEVLGNLFGSDKSGTLDRGGEEGLNLQLGAQALIGSSPAPNRFAFHSHRALRVLSNDTRATAAANLFIGADQFAIDLLGDGVTPNDPGDGDSGPNGLLNFPVLTLAERTESGIRVVGNLDVPPGLTTVAVYASSSCHASGHGPGEQLLGIFAPATLSFDHSLSTDVDLDDFAQITATASNTSGTSEMSACLTASDPPPGIAVDSAADGAANGGCDVGGDGNPCTLREAIALANAQAGADTIRFSIPGEGPHVITLGSLLPVITGATVIDGYTQLGAVPNADPLASDAVLKVELRAPGLSHVLRTCTSGLVDLRGLAIHGGSSATIATQLNDSASCSAVGSLRLRGNWIGFQASGAGAFGSTGIAANNTLVAIGESALADRNVIGGYSLVGVRIAGTAANASTVANNVFGREPDLGNGAANGRGVDLVNVSQVSVGGEGGLANQFHGGSTSIFVSGANSDFNRLYGNTFAGATGGTAIDLASGSSPDGITPNDVNDADSGANDGQNTPVLTDGAATAGSITINGLLDVPTGIAAPVNYRIAVYFSAFCSDDGGIFPDRNGNEYLGSFLRPFASNAENFSVTVGLPPQPGFITATATAPDGSTSEISNCLVAPQPQAVFGDGFE